MRRVYNNIRHEGFRIELIPSSYTSKSFILPGFKTDVLAVPTSTGCIDDDKLLRYLILHDEGFRLKNSIGAANAKYNGRLKYRTPSQIHKLEHNVLPVSSLLKYRPSQSSPSGSGHRQSTLRAIRTSTERVFDVASRMGAESVHFLLGDQAFLRTIASGNGHYQSPMPLEDVLRTKVQAVINLGSKHDSLRRVGFVVFSEENYTTSRKALNRLLL